MAGQRKDVTLQEALQALKITDEDAVNTFNAASQTPIDLASHMVAKEFIVNGITPSDFLKEHGSTQFSLADLETKFSTICTDYPSGLEIETKSMALDFCSRVLYTIGPDSRKVKRTVNKIYKLKFKYASEHKKLIIRTAFVSTYRRIEYAENYIPGVKIYLTIKQAELLAIRTFLKLIPIAHNLPKPVVLMTPLAGSIFSKDYMQKIADELNVQIAAVSAAVNASCQSGGQHLPESAMHIAIVSVITATRNVKDENVRKLIILETIKQYYNAKKEFDPIKFVIYAKYATGGIPANLEVNKLLTEYENAQSLTRAQAARAGMQSAARSIVLAPAANL